MRLTFKNNKLQKSCSERNKAIKTYGPKCSEKLMQRLMELQAFENLAQVPHLPPLRCHELSGKLKGTFAVDLVQPMRLLFRPDHDPIPRDADGGIDLSKVTVIQVVSVEDYH